jgi:putative PEP-CTERM system histidine kinase
LRARLRVLLLKHFYRNKYDYRDEWLRLTQNLGRSGDVPSAASNGLAALARIVGSPGGGLYVQQDPHRYTLVATLDPRSKIAQSYDQAHPLVTFMISTGWVVDTDEYAREPDRYGTAFGAPADGALPPNTIVVPLDSQGLLHGFVTLQRPVGLAPLNFEDHDILKTAGRQIAAVLVQALAQEHLAQTRQFEAMNKLSAFLMHDLKNIVAQQELVVANAQRFRDRPGFFDDAIATIRTGVDRMKRVLEQLSNQASQGQSSRRVDVSKLLMEVRSQCADRRPVPEVISAGKPAWVWMDRERLASALLHLVRNAQDATPTEGRITLELQAGNDALRIVVADTGCGMDAAFIRDRLFRPFDSTKGVQGMGIGAYQVRHLVQAAGGDVEVSSEPAVGTTFVIRLPVSNAA